MTCPGTYPTVLNGQVYYNDSSTVEFECLSGFYMTGNKRITCTAGVWETAPTCSVIRQYDEVTVFRESRPSSYLPLAVQLRGQHCMPLGPSMLQLLFSFATQQ